ncbi:molecular chaperone GrpE [Bacillus pakistanensis]|uniref:Protein GrpE n=1 Tax=Rossellomorea pakistanensis TaxID=992288 RepID=A0ABS2NA64_9BACI|nr:nucleotide exchange factor GrpE [Bacillus pakistanensis]MBM7584738.1 molecular chaperone GrpE [Bacillus pakistanensis]
MNEEKQVTEEQEEKVETQVDENIEEIFDESGTEGNNEENAVSDAEKLQAQLDESENRYLRLRADFDNFRRRVTLDQESNRKYRSQSLISDLLPALDNFERALNIEAENDQTKSLLQGMEMVYRSLMDALKKEGVEEIESVGQQFDPHLHQAVMQDSDDQYESNVVIEEFQKGYKLNDRIIRPSMVKVNQ